MRIRKLIATAMALLLMVTALCSCKKGTALSEEIIVSENDIWYDSTRFKLESPETSQNRKSFCTGVSYKNGKVYASYRSIDSMNYADVWTYLNIYDLDGTCSTLKIDYPDDNDETILRTCGILPNDDGSTATAVVQKSVVSVMDWTYYFATIDLNTGKSSELKKIDDINGMAMVVLETKIAGNYLVFICSKVNSTDMAPVLVLFDGEKYLSTLDLNKDVKEASLYNIENMSLEENGDLSFSCQCSEGRFFFKYDPVNSSMYDKNLQSFADIRKQSDTDKADIKDFSLTAEGVYLRTDRMGNIYEYNKDNQTADLMIDCNQYSPYLSDYSVSSGYSMIDFLTCKDGRIVMLFSGITQYTKEQDTDYMVTVLNKAQSNPHVGKKVIELGFRESCSDYMSAAVYYFNKKDDEYLIRLRVDDEIGAALKKLWSSPIYSFSASSGSDSLLFSTQDELQSQVLSENAYEQKMSEDLRGTDVPDIILDLQYERAYNDDCLEDLSDYLDPEVKAMLFENITEATKYNDKAYFLPVTIRIDGVLCPEEYVKEGTVGFTFDEYEKFVREQSNGIESFISPTDMLIACIDVNSSIEKDKVNFGTEQFKSALDYARNRYVFADVSVLDEHGEYTPQPTPVATYLRLSSYKQYINYCLKPSKPYVMLGAPSIDASGPRFEVNESISVAKASEVKEGVKRFLNFLFGGEFMEEVKAFDSICINKNVLEYTLPNINEQCNQAYYSYLSGGWNARELTGMGIKITTDLMCEQFIKSVSSLTYYYHEDSELTLILVEETYSYFIADKSPDEVISIINDRVQKIVDEQR